MLFRSKKIYAIKEHLEKTEVEFLKMDIIMMCGEEFTLEDISKYFDPDLDIMGGTKKRKVLRSHGCERTEIIGFVYIHFDKSWSGRLNSSVRMA